MRRSAPPTDPCVECGHPVPEQAGEPVCHDCTLARGIVVGRGHAATPGINNSDGGPMTETTMEAYDLLRAFERWRDAPPNVDVGTLRGLVWDIARKAAAMNGDVVVPASTNAGQQESARAMQNHVAELLRLLHLGDHARTESPAAVMEHEVIPAVHAVVEVAGYAQTLSGRRHAWAIARDNVVRRAREVVREHEAGTPITDPKRLVSALREMDRLAAPDPEGGVV